MTYVYVHVHVYVHGYVHIQVCRTILNNRGEYSYEKLVHLNTVLL